MWLTRLALRNPVLILMLSLMAIALGSVSLQRLSVDLFPQIDIPIIRVATFYSGAGPVDIEKSITMPVERAVSAAPGVDRVESTSKQGFSVVSVWFQYGTNLDNAQFEVSQRVAQILNTLPPGITQPFVLKFDVTNIPVVQIAMNGVGLDERQLYDLAYNVIEPQLERIRGVANASVGGGKIREIEVNVDRDALRARGLAILDVVNQVRSSNLLLPSGNLRAGDRDYNVFSNTQVDEARPLRDIIIRPPSPSHNGSASGSVRLSDVASVVDGEADQSEIVRINGSRGVFFRVLKQPGANTVAVVDAVRAALPKLRGVPPTVQLQIAFDQSSYIRAAIASLEHEAVQGGVLAVAIILLFLVSLSATGIIAVAIPLSIIATFILLYFTGQTLNVFTLGGLALGVGRLVDDSIVELENIHRHLEMGGDRRQAVLAAAEEVAMPILVSTITTIVVFFPVVFLTGVAKNLFLPLALTIAFSLIMSFFVSRTVTPLLCLRYLKAGQHGGATRLGQRLTAFFDRLDEAYGRALAVVLRHRLVVIGSIMAIFCASLVLAKHLGTEFFPDTDESQFQVVFKTPIGTRVERTDQVIQRIEKTIRQTLDGQHSDDPKSDLPPTTGSATAQNPTLDAPAPAGGDATENAPLVQTILSSSGLPAGRTAVFAANTGPHSGTVSVNLVPRTDRSISDVEALTKVRESLRDVLPGTNFFMVPGGIVKRVLNFGSSAPIDVEIVGYDIQAGTNYAKQLLLLLRSISDSDGSPLLTDVQMSREENYPELNVEVDREKAGMLGITEQQVAQSVLASLVGSNQFAPISYADRDTGNPYYINIKLDDRFRSHVSDLSEVFVRSPQGKLVQLSNLAHIRRGGGPVLIARKYLQRIVDVTANVAPGKDLGKASSAVAAIVRDNPPPEGFTAELGGQTAAQKQAFSSLWFAAIMAIALVYMILASQFRSLVDPLVIMFSVPLGVSGVFVALYLTGTTLSVNSFMGIIMMVGIVVSNGVLLVDFARVLRRRGESLVDATILAGKTRLRPILMTTIATVVGLLPMAIGLGEGSETNLPLARAVIGGLTVSTFFTLFLIPALYTLFDRFSPAPDFADDVDDDDNDDASRATSSTARRQRQNLHV